MVLPFGLLLAAMAVGPILAPAWWSRHYPKVTAGLAAVTAGYYFLVLRASGRVLQAGHEYFSFMVLIGSLFVVAGGIHLAVKGQATPRVNTLFLLVGAIAANLLGTTGASVLLVRPWIQMNRGRMGAHHIVFFIFIVSNVGGCLTPVGDPPLFLGYLEGIPFWWVARHCWPMWAVAVGYLLALFYALDTRNYCRAPREVRLQEAGPPGSWREAGKMPAPRLSGRLQEAGPPGSWRLEGLGNLVWLLLIVGAVFITHPVYLRESLMLAGTAASYFTTKKSVHEANQFDLHPLREVAILFAGIFVTMIPALDWLQTHAGRLGQPTPALFYWASGTVSSLLDSAPAYLSFLHAALGLFVPSETVDPAQMLANSPLNAYLLAVSLGAVFFGANTYIGNGPNLMVKAIAERQDVRVPGFLGFIIKYSLPCMGPMLLLIWLLFLR